MKAYFEYIAENERAFTRFRFNMFIVIICLIAFYFAYLFGKHELDDYAKTSGRVQYIDKGTIQVKPEGTYDFRDYVKKDVIDIWIKNEHFIVRDDHGNGKSITLNQIKRSDSIAIYFSPHDGYNEIVEINKAGKMILNHKGFMKKWSFLYYFFPFLIVGFVLLFLWLYRMRKSNIR